MNRLALAGALVWLAACMDTELPPPPGPGAITGRVLVASAGDPLGRPAAGATVRLVEAGLTVTTQDDGRFELRPVPLTRGTLRFSAGSLERVMTLEAIGAGPGKQTVLGDVALSRNAAVQGEVLLEDDPVADGTLVFIEGELASTFSGRDGQFLLRELPVGPVTVGLFRRGYAPVVLPVELRSGERFVLERVVLRRQPPGTSRVRGLARLADREDSSGVAITTASAPATTTATTGDYAFAALEQGVHSFGFTREGFGTVTLANRLVAGAEVVLPEVMLVPGTSASPQVVPPFPTYDGGLADAGKPDPDAGTADAGETDAGLPDAGPPDAGLPDAGPPDAGPPDAGPPDAGPPDAGPPDAGPPDAGPPDAGPPDAGPPDAGPPDAGPPDAGQPDAGAPDAGPDLFPVAIIGPLPGRMLQDAGPLLLDGTGSYGSPVITQYAWLVDAGTARLRDGGIARPSSNNSAFSAAPNLELPLPPAVVTVSLQVTDAIGRVSAPAVTGFVVGDRPLALFDAGSLPTQLYSNEVAIIDATPSRDTVGSNLVSRRWVTSPSTAVTTAPLANDAQLRLTVGNVPFTQQFVVSHYVTNGLGFESLERSHTITLLAGSMPSSPWSVTTSGAAVVDGGTPVALIARLDAGSQLAAYADPANFDWLWTSSTDAGSPQQWAITDPTRPSTSFVPPVVEGANVRYDFTVTATPRPPLTGSPQSADLVVLAQDKVRPTLNGNTSGGAVGSTMGTLLTFSEPMIPVTNANIDVVRMPANVSVITGRIFRGNQMMFVTRPPSLTAELWDFRLTHAAATDTANNPMIPLDARSQYISSFSPEVRWTAPHELSTGELTIEPLPLFVPAESPVIGQHTGVVYARVGSTLVRGSTASVLTQCTTPPCTLSQQTIATGVSTGASVASSLVKAESGLYVQPVAGETWGIDGGSLPTGPGLVFSNGSRLGSVYVSGSTLRLAELDGGLWDTGNALTAATSSTSYPIDGTTIVAGAAGGESLTARTTCLTALTGTRVVPLYRRDSNAFSVPATNNPAASGLSVVQTRVSASATTCFWAHVLSDGRVAYVARVTSDTFSTGNLQYLIGGGVSAMDFAVDPYNALGSIVWVATVESGQLFLYYSTGATNSAVRVTPPGSSLNADPACIASRPTLTQLEQALYVTWQEQCAGQPYKVYVRGLY